MIVLATVSGWASLTGIWLTCSVGCPSYVDPARMALACDLDAHDGVKGALVDAVVTMAHSGAIDVFRDNEDQGVCCFSECSFDGGGVEQPECDIQCLAEASVGVVTDVSCMGDDANS